MKTMMTRKDSMVLGSVCLVAGAVFTAATPAQADVIAFDNFDYPDGSLVPNGGWANHSGILGDLLVSGGQVMVQHGVPSEDASLAFAAVSGMVFYGINFMVADLGHPYFGTDNEYFAHFRNRFDFSARLDVVEAPGGGDFSVGIATDDSFADQIWPADLSFGVSYRAVVGYDQDANLAQLWIDASITTDPSIFGDDQPDKNGDSVTSFALRQSDSRQNELIRVDGLVIGTTFEDVVFKIKKGDCPADFDGSGDVGVKDLLFLLGAWGPCPPKGDCPADFDNTGDVGVKDLLFLLGAWGPCPGGPPQLVYSHEFVNGVIYCPGDPQYDDWLSYRASLPTSGVTSITVSGSQDPTGRTCSDAFIAQQIADAMRNQTNLTVECGGFTWTVGVNCQAIGCALPDNDLLLSADGDSCGCSTTYTVRPGIGNENWGGITGGSCGSPTQIMTVTIQ